MNIKSDKIVLKIKINIESFPIPDNKINKTF